MKAMRDKLRKEYEIYYNKFCDNNTASRYLVFDMMDWKQLNLYIIYLENKLLDMMEKEINKNI